MAVEILRLRNDGPAGRKAGAIIAIKECEDFKECVWGRDECPPVFDRQRVNGIQKAQLPPEMLEYGGHKSRVLLDKGRLSLASMLVLDGLGMVALDLAELMTATVDQGKDWNVEAKVVK